MAAPATRRRGAADGLRLARAAMARRGGARHPRHDRRRDDRDGALRHLSFPEPAALRPHRQRAGAASRLDRRHALRRLRRRRLSVRSRPRRLAGDGDRGREGARGFGLGERVVRLDRDRAGLRRRGARLPIRRDPDRDLDGLAAALARRRPGSARARARRDPAALRPLCRSLGDRRRAARPRRPARARRPLVRLHGRAVAQGRRRRPAGKRPWNPRRPTLRPARLHRRGTGRAARRARRGPSRLRRGLRARRDRRLAPDRAAFLRRRDRHRRRVPCKRHGATAIRFTAAGETIATARTPGETRPWLAAAAAAQARAPPPRLPSNLRFPRARAGPDPPDGAPLSSDEPN